MVTPDGSKLFVNNLEDNARQNIMKLDQKLKGLHAEIEAKLNSLSLDGDVHTENAELLVALLNEIKQAMTSIGGLVNLVISEDEELEQNYLQSEEVAQFNKMVSENLEKIIQIRNEF